MAQREPTQVLTLYLSQGSGRDAAAWALASDDNPTRWLVEQLQDSDDEDARENVRYVLSTRPVVVRTGATTPEDKRPARAPAGAFKWKWLLIAVYVPLVLAVLLPLVGLGRLYRRLRGWR